MQTPLAKPISEFSSVLAARAAQAGLNARQQAYLENFITQYDQRHQTSKQLAQTYRSVLADARVGAGFEPLLKELVYPIVGDRAAGSRAWDADGNEYVDFLMGFGVHLLGHNPPVVQQALIERLQQGMALGLQSDLVGEVATLISDFTGMERVAFSNTGTEAVMTAIRLARAATKRQKIVLFAGSYHGHFDGTLVKRDPTVTEQTGQAVPRFPGVPAAIAQDVLVLKYGDPRSLEIIQAHADQLAAVLVEPVQKRRLDLQPQAFLQQLRRLTQDQGIALIFDEMLTGFRIHPGGAQAWFGVRADIATYGKIIGGGMPIGVIAGSAKYLDKIDGGQWQYGDDSAPQVETTYFAGTYCKHPLVMTAAKAILQHLKAEGDSLQQQLNQQTQQLSDRLNQYFTQVGIPIQMVNFGSLFGPASDDATTETSKQSAASITMILLSYHLQDQGILLFPDGSGILSTAHTDADSDRLLRAVENSVHALYQGGFLG
ncbi:MAG: aminotransferase class III-fold pyridoxal phosphate-dependent enzyme [Trichocoleus desertorum ATA4-8-CV12]|jgi:glutamate-1-semialdehyde aminotransferase|nr:aminotransferase class III-fold pyridoxal phosphate-dependent enzyme [Trichocoleus desertorum ATA4-8-CV12]